MAGDRGELNVEAVQTVHDLAGVLRHLRRRQARQRRDSPLTYRELAARTGWAHGAIGDYFAGNVLPPTDRFDVLVRMLGATASEQGPLATARDRVEENRRNRRAEPAMTGKAGMTGRTATSPSAPWELPGPVRGFVGRDGQLAELDALLADAQGGQRVVISAMAGTAGVGKTALAVHWAHRVMDRFPDGCLYVDLRGYGQDQPMRPEEALAGFLRSMGVDGARVPADLAGLAARCRSLLAGRRMLIMLDNARSAEQVRPLLPGSPGCFVVVTSRDAMAGLVARDGAHRLDLDLLPAADALALLRRLIGARVDAEPEAADALAQQCARLPLALRIAAEFAVSRPAVPLAELVDELACLQRRLELLDAGGDPDTAVRAVFSWSYQALPGPAAHAFRLLGTHPGRDVDVHAAAALTGCDLDAARGLLDQLLRAHLVQSAGGGRYAMHDLLRGYAIERATVETPRDAQQAALTRLFDHYLHTAAAAMDALYPGEQHRRPRIAAAPGQPQVITAGQALAWLDAECANLVATVRHAAEHGWPDHSWKLAQTVWRHLDAGGHHATALTMHNHAHRAALAQQNGGAVIASLLALGTAHTRLGRYADAIEHYQQAHDQAERLGDQAAVARSLNNLGNVHWRLGHYAEALDQCGAAIVIYRRLGDLASAGGTLTNVGLVHQQLGRHQEALRYLDQALAVARELGDRLGEVHALVNLGVVRQRLGEHAEAVDLHRRAHDIATELGDRTGAGLALVNLGMAHLGLGAHAEALQHLERALAISRDTGDRDVETDALNTMGEALRAMGRDGAALDHHRSALAIAEEFDDRLEQARALDGIAHALAGAGRDAQAREHWRRVLDLYTELGLPEADAARARLFAASSAQGR